MSKLFGVSVDYLLFDNVPREGVAAINDIQLYEYFLKTEALPNEKKQLIKDLINAVVFRERVKEMPEAQIPEVQSKSSALRKFSGKR